MKDGTQFVGGSTVVAAIVALSVTIHRTGRDVARLRRAVKLAVAACPMTSTGRPNPFVEAQYVRGVTRPGSPSLEPVPVGVGVAEHPWQCDVDCPTDIDDLPVGGKARLDLRAVDASWGGATTTRGEDEQQQRRGWCGEAGDAFGVAGTVVVAQPVEAPEVAHQIERAGQVQRA